MSVQVKGSGTIGGLDEGLVVSGIVTSSTQINVGSNIKLGNAGVITATSFVGSGANLTGIVADKIYEGNTEAEVVDTGSDGHFKVTTEGSERLRINSYGQIGINTTTGGLVAIAMDSSNTNPLATGFIALTLKNTNTTDNTSVCMDFNNSVGGIVGRFGAQFKDTSDKDTDLYFATRADGGSLTERLRIDSAGDIFIGTSTDIAPTNGTNLCVSDATISRIILEKQSTIKFGLNVSSGFTIYDETNDAARFNINQYGHVTKPNNLCLQYTGTGDITSGTVTYATEVFDVGDSNAYNTSNGEFTAPVTGVYRIQYEHFASGAGRATAAIQKHNGSSWSTVKNGMRVYSVSGGSNWASVPTIFYLQLNATEKFKIIHLEGTIHLNTPWNHMTVQLVQ